jgi:hypothetical protein
MDYAVEAGLICNPVKVVPPCQEIKYTGFIFDTTGGKAKPGPLHDQVHPKL